MSVGRETTTANFQPRPLDTVAPGTHGCSSIELLKLLSAGRSAGAAAKGGAGESGAGVAQHVVSGKLHSRVISTTKNRVAYWEKYMTEYPVQVFYIHVTHAKRCLSSSKVAREAVRPDPPFLCKTVQRCISLGANRLHEILQPQPALDVLPVTSRETSLVDEHRPPEPEFHGPRNVIPARHRGVAFSLEVSRFREEWAPRRRSMRTAARCFETKERWRA